MQQVRFIVSLAALLLLGSCQNVSSTNDPAQHRKTQHQPAVTPNEVPRIEHRASRFAPAVPLPAVPLDPGKTLNRIALGSCFHPSLTGAIFDEIASQQPDAFVFLGDNVYAADESDDPALMSLRQAYADLSHVESFRQLRRNTPLLVTWDDHDYGKDDAGGEFLHRQFSESLYEYVWDVQKTDPRAERPGVYYEKTAGPEGKRVQLIMLDTRSFRTALTRHPDQNTGRYIESQDPNQNVLGETQWLWLEEQLRKPADIRVLVSSVQLIADGHYWEAWRVMPKERERLYQLLNSTRANGVVIVSGDRHAAAIYKLAGFQPYPLYELTTSSLNVPLTSFVKNPVDEPGAHRLIAPYYEANYGLIDIDWDSRLLSLKLMDDASRLISEVVLPVASLQPFPADQRH